MLRYKRVLIKLSGGALAGKDGIGFDPNMIEHIVSEVLSVASLGVQVAILTGGGNIFAEMFLNSGVLNEPKLTTSV